MPKNTKSFLTRDLLSCAMICACGNTYGVVNEDMFSNPVFFRCLAKHFATTRNVGLIFIESSMHWIWIVI